VNRFYSYVYYCNAVKIGKHFVLRSPKTDGKRRYDGGWFLERPVEGKVHRMHFGQVLSMFLQDGQLFLKVQWYRTKEVMAGDVFHPEIRAPLVSQWDGPKDKEGEGIEIVHVSRVVPWACYGSELKRSPSTAKPRIVMVARHWHILHALQLPSPPSKLKFPEILIKPSIPSVSVSGEGASGGRKKARRWM